MGGRQPPAHLSQDLRPNLHVRAVMACGVLGAGTCGHVLPKGIQRVRHYGVLANGCKKTLWPGPGRRWPSLRHSPRRWSRPGPSWPGWPRRPSTPARIARGRCRWRRRCLAPSTCLRRDSVACRRAKRCPQCTPPCQRGARREVAVGVIQPGQNRCRRCSGGHGCARHGQHGHQGPQCGDGACEC